MAHESFEDQATAERMNRWFVNVKVDREERPDVDGVYMSAVQALTGQGGWPMTVFLTPKGKPFYAGTYFPPVDGHRRPGFPRVLEAIAEAWRNEREKLLSSADAVTEHLKAATSRFEGEGQAEVTSEQTDAAVAAFRASFDGQWGGFGDAPKFPSPANLDFLLAHATRVADSGEPSALNMVLLTLVRMASGGMYDHLGGGFARYSVDRSWLVPHFEKMLYDNAQLVRTYLHAYQLTSDGFYERVVRETLAYLEREMRDPEGGFFSAQDADSEGIEGKYFVWTPQQVREALGDEDAAIFNAWFAVTEEGNFRDPHHPEFGTRNVLTTWQDADDVAAAFAVTREQLAERIAGMTARMLDVRERRVKPGLDDKVLTSWNGLALAAFAEAARVLGDTRYRAIAEANARFVRETLWRDGELLHTSKAGVAKVHGMAEDYAYYGLGLVELYKLTGDLAHLGWAREMLEILVRDFRDGEDGGFFETANHAEALLLRQKSFFDAATPSGNGATALLALWLSRYYANDAWEQVALEVLGLVQPMIAQAPSGFGTLLQCMEFLLSPPREIVVVGAPERREPLEREAARHSLPWVAIAPTVDATGLPMFEGRQPANGAVQAFVCENMVCNLPVSTPAALREQVAG
jgi:uncharacterized protein YyaL (SSP411 family)